MNCPRREGEGQFKYAEGVTEISPVLARRAEAVRRRMRAYAGKSSHKIILPLLAE
jgi:hypothetical protein